MAIDYQTRIPNNVDLGANATLQRALEHWQPRFLDWWREMGPSDFLNSDVYLRTAISVDAKGWANWDMVKMPDYRWGIFLAEPEADRRIGFGDRIGDPAWQQVPGEHRTSLRRLIVTQGDTEPASVEQQRLLGHTAPSLYDLRSLFQVNVEEGRHLWAMVYLLHGYFGRDGREEAEELLGRHSGDADRPRILSTFNEPIADWLSFFMFTYFTDRDGKFQLMSFAESGFDPLARTCRFMLMEEAHHMMVGVNGIARIVKRTLEVMKALKTDEPDKVRAAGAVDLPTIQRYLNFWFSSSLDLFGAEVSTNAAAYFANGIKGRPDEAHYDEHRCLEGAFAVETPTGTEQVPLRNAMNEVMRGSYIKDCDNGVQRWARMVEEAGFAFALKLPSPCFNRTIGAWANLPVDPEGRLIDRAAFDAWRERWIPSAADKEFVQSLMKPVTSPGKVAGWIAVPERGINRLPVEHEYVRVV
jgi:benzoyl-CoA 2,3-dioxygenase component B